MYVIVTKSNLYFSIQDTLVPLLKTQRMQHRHLLHKYATQQLGLCYIASYKN